MRYHANWFLRRKGVGIHFRCGLYFVEAGASSMKLVEHSEPKHQLRG